MGLVKVSLRGSIFLVGQPSTLNRHGQTGQTLEKWFKLRISKGIFSPFIFLFICAVLFLWFFFVCLRPFFVNQFNFLPLTFFVSHPLLAFFPSLVRFGRCFETSLKYRKNHKAEHVATRNCVTLIPPCLQYHA